MAQFGILPTLRSCPSIHIPAITPARGQAVLTSSAATPSRTDFSARLARLDWSSDQRPSFAGTDAGLSKPVRCPERRKQRPSDLVLTNRRSPDLRLKITLVMRESAQLL